MSHSETRSSGVAIVVIVLLIIGLVGLAGGGLLWGLAWLALHDAHP